MPQQLDLLGQPELQLHPRAGHTEPRLWVRRLVIWSEPGVVLRQVPLRPGLNIVWSPDPADQQSDEALGALGHCSGKTLFCRLIRYCLGEEQFSPKDQEDNVALAFKNGLVGAEVVLDGVVWAIVRQIGIGKRNIAVPGGDLDALAAGSEAANGVEAFLEAVETALLSRDIVALMPGEQAHKAWLIVLAWLARDQECRFDDVLDWRRAISESGSPARGLSATATLDALRALLGAVDPKERKLYGEIAEMEHSRSEMKREAAHREWQTIKKRRQLADALSLREDELPYAELAIKVFKDSAREKLSAVAIADPSVDVSNIDALRTEYDEARSREFTLASDLDQVDVYISEIDASVRRMQGETPGLSFSLHQAEHPICPICEVPVDRVLAEGCKLSHKVPDLEEVRRRRDQAREELAKEKGRLDDYKQKKPVIAAALASARAHAIELRRRLQAAEHARDNRAEAWYSARRLMDEADRLYSLLGEKEKAAAKVGHLEEKIAKKRDEVAAFRDERAHVFRRLSDIFDSLVRTLVGPRATGKVTLDGNGLHLAVELGGERSSPAIGSLKVLAFDLAAMCMSIEGRTHVPAFLIHDSPREADLGLSPYHRLFELVRTLEDISTQPLFQYIVTTTTRPPENLQKEPWLVLTLGGEPAEKRLLKRDLR
jgi:hypothetical protein